jgi:RNA recognition motif-containing protein
MRLPSPEISKDNDKCVIVLIYRVGRTKGYAFVYLKNASDLDKAIEYIDGRHIRSRQVRAKK